VPWRDWEAGKAEATAAIQGVKSVATNSFVRRARAIVVLGLVGGTIAAAVGAAPASAGLGLACPSPTSTPFMSWKDYANYAFSPDGGFEGGGSGWSLSGGARVVSGNESFYVHSTGDRLSLSLPAGASATTPPMCISLFSSKMRFLTKGSYGSKVKVQIIYRGILSSLLGILDGGTVSPSGSWNAAPAIGMLGGTLPLLTASVSFRFTAVGAGASIDDVYLDPMKSS
jgi:hypothetical protein